MDETAARSQPEDFLVSQYLVRVELHKATESDYEALHRAMAGQGFSRTIRGSDGIDYKLPTAEYVVETTKSGDTVRSAADTAANTTGRKHGVLVAACNGTWWLGLDKA